MAKTATIDLGTVSSISAITVRQDSNPGDLKGSFSLRTATAAESGPWDTLVSYGDAGTDARVQQVTTFDVQGACVVNARYVQFYNDVSVAS